MTMDCDSVRERFSDHIDGCLPESEEDLLGKHMVWCAACRRALAELELAAGALAGRAPEPDPDLAGRIQRAAAADGLLVAPPRRLAFRLWPLAACVALVAGGYLIGTYRHPASPAPAPGLDLAFGSACVGSLAGEAPDPTRLYRLGPIGRHALDLGGATRVTLPASLGSHGPYSSRTDPAGRADSGACLPLSAPYGDLLFLALAPLPAGAGLPEGEFRVQPDPARVFYARVVWARAGLIWSLEGRAGPGELLDLAAELAAGAQVERI